MQLSTLSCPSCGGNHLSRDETGLRCAFCGATVSLEMPTGAICGDLRDGAACTEPAESLCRLCGRPLCDRHNDPQRLYWSEHLDLRCLLADWSEGDAVSWERVNADDPRLPVAGIGPAEWTDHLRRSDYAIGQIEDEIRAAITALVARAAGEVGEQACTLASVCSGCRQRLDDEIEALIRAFLCRYLKVAWTDRLDALENHLQQSLHYVEARLGRPVQAGEAEPDRAALFARLTADNPDEAWDACGRELLHRLRLMARLRRKRPSVMPD